MQVALKQHFGPCTSFAADLMPGAFRKLSRSPLSILDIMERSSSLGEKGSKERGCICGCTVIKWGCLVMRQVGTPTLNVCS